MHDDSDSPKRACLRLRQVQYNVLYEYVSLKNNKSMSGKI